ncbi:MAG: VOC family protein [bacterium]|nr:VOC family protein [Gammaproteobacteria bacterium]
MRPPVWIGHVSLKVHSLSESEQFYLKTGLRLIFKNDAVCILELRGGTHLILGVDANAESGNAEFDFMVENVDESHESYREAGLKVSDISRGDIHDSFFLTDPSANRITVNSTHVDDHSLV